MGSDDEFEELPRERFEDELDMLEFCYEKIEFAVYIWALWIKAFGEGLDEQVSRKLMNEIVDNIHTEIFAKIVPVIDTEGPDIVLHGFIRRFHTPARSRGKEILEPPQA